MEITQNKPEIINKYIGAFSTKFPVHSCISPDECWILSGSEDGNIFIPKIKINHNQNIKGKLHLWGI